MHILVTGASGFVGRTLCATLTRAGHKVTRAVRRDDGRPDTVVTGELGASCEWLDAVECPDVIVHLAARVHQMKEAPTEAERLHRLANTEGTLMLARRACERGVRRFVFISTVKVNGEGARRAYRSDDPPQPADAYARSKAAAEAGLMEIGARSGMEIVVIRPPLVYGPGVAGIFASLLYWVRRGRPLPFGAITRNRRSLVSVDNLASFIQRCIEHPDAAGAIWMVSDGEDVSTAELLRRMARALGKPARLWWVPPALLHALVALTGRRAVMRRLCGDLYVEVSDARRTLGWTPPMTLDEGLRRCAE